MHRYQHGTPPIAYSLLDQTRGGVIEPDSAPVHTFEPCLAHTGTGTGTGASTVKKKVWWASWSAGSRRRGKGTGAPGRSAVAYRGPCRVLLEAAGVAVTVPSQSHIGLEGGARGPASVLTVSSPVSSEHNDRRRWGYVRLRPHYCVHFCLTHCLRIF